MSITGAEIVVDVLEREGVDVAFGYPGGAILDLADALDRSEKIRMILTRHEQGAGHMADGYARASGRPGIMIITSGPGATNTVTALLNAYMDSVPIVMISGQVPTAVIGNDAFQEADVVGITRPCTKHNFLVKDIRELANTLREAFHIATTGRPGPVVVDLPKDVQQARLEDYVWPETVSIRSYKPVSRGNPRQIASAARAIERARRPVLCCGGGVISSNAHAELLQLAEKCQIPVTTTLLGLGAFPEDHPLSLKMLGMHGSAFANHAVNECDCLIAVGARFDDRVTGKLATFAPNCRDNIVHIDVDPSAISKNIAVTVPVVGDCRLVLQDLLKEIQPLTHPEWIEKVGQWKAQFPLTYDGSGDAIKPQFALETLYKVTGGDAIVTTDVGQHQMWAAQFWTTRQPRTFLTSGGLGTMGYGLPAALGAQVAFPDRLVINISGDGSIQMNQQELSVAALNGLPVKNVILDNTYLGMVRQWQQLFYERRYVLTPLHRVGNPKLPTEHLSVEEMPAYLPDFVKLAEAHGCVGIRVTRKDDLIPAYEEMLKTPRPVVLDVMTAMEENVYPMIPAGKSIREMIANHEDFTRGLS